VSTPPISLSPGDRLGRYQIIALLGAGGMGEVYRARDPELKREVAIKVLRRTVAGPEDIARFSREARAAGALNHANIVIVYDVGVEAACPACPARMVRGSQMPVLPANVVPSDAIVHGTTGATLGRFTAFS